MAAAPSQDVEEFFQRYPCDSRAQDYLRSSPEQVAARALREFRPPREGEVNYSALLVNFVKSLRAELLSGPGASSQLGGPGLNRDAASLEADIQAFRQQFPFDEAAYNYLMNSTPEVQWAVLRDFRPKSEGEGDYSALVITFTKKCRLEAQRPPGPPPQAYYAPPPPQAHYAPPPPQAHYAPPPPPPPPHGHYAPPPRAHYAPPPQTVATLPPRPAEDPAMLLAEVQAFRDRYPFDEEAYSYLVASPQEVQRQVLQEFRPKQEGQTDYSALVISFSKRCRSGFATMQARAPPRHAAGGLPAPAPHVAPPPSGGPSPAEYEAFRQRYPHDEAAHNYLMNSPPHVQLQALRTFTPKREGEIDYSALFITYTKKCRNNVQVAPPPASRRGFGNGTARPTAPGGYPPPRRAPLADLEGFRLRYPMDDRAFTYLQESLPEVQRQVVETFVPKRADDVDFSAPIVAYAKLCRARFTEAASFGLNAVAPGPGFGSHPAPYPALPPPAPDDQALEPEISAFCHRFPMDQRARDFLWDSPPGVIVRVLREFRPKREGDTDYSAAVVYFVGLCRKEAGFDAGGGGTMPTKRMRLAY